MACTVCFMYTHKQCLIKQNPIQVWLKYMYNIYMYIPCMNIIHSVGILYMELQLQNKWTAHLWDIVHRLTPWIRIRYCSSGIAFTDFCKWHKNPEHLLSKAEFQLSLVSIHWEFTLMPGTYRQCIKYGISTSHTITCTPACSVQMACSLLQPSVACITFSPCFTILYNVLFCISLTPYMPTTKPTVCA